MSLYERAIKDELAYWPGTEVEFSKRKKHCEARIHFGGSTRFVVYPDSPSDSARGHLNFLRDVRKELVELGAARLPKKPAKRKRGPRVIGKQMPRRPQWVDRVEQAPVKDNPFDALAALVQVAQRIEHGDSTSTAAGSNPARHTIFRRFLRRIGGGK